MPSDIEQLRRKYRVIGAPGFSERRTRELQFAALSSSEEVRDNKPDPYR